jgi:hypothetical protein
MATTWRVGDLAECIDDKPGPTSKGNWPLLVRGRIYRVIAVIPHPRGLALQLDGLHRLRPDHWRGLFAHRFRKIDGDKAAWAQLLAEHQPRINAKV